jgi:hypothetical protein
MTPPAGPAVAATGVRIAGVGLAAGEGWKAFLATSPLLEVAAAGHSELRALVPPEVPGPSDLLVLGVSRLARLRRAYTRGPLIPGLDPAPGDAAGGGRVRVYLAGLPSGDLPEILFGEAKALEVVRPLEGVLVVTAPPGPVGTTVSVRLTHPLGDAAGGGYTYLPTLKVPGDFPSLAEAAAAAADGSRIELGPGAHELALSIARLRLEIVGTEGARATALVKGTGTVGLRLSAGADVTLRGVTVTPGQASPPGPGILVGQFHFFTSSVQSWSPGAVKSADCPPGTENAGPNVPSRGLNQRAKSGPPAAVRSTATRPPRGR